MRSVVYFNLIQPRFGGSFHMRALLLGCFFVASLLSGAATAQESGGSDLVPKLHYQFQPSGALLNGENAGQPEGVSGIACMSPTEAGARRCLVINDERRKAQFVTMENAAVVPGDDVNLIEKKASESTLGQAPQVSTCSGGSGDFEELDGEGVSYAAPYFYVVGSHGCSRKKRKFKLSSFILTRFIVDAEGKPQGNVETTYRLSDVLRLDPTIGPFFGKDLMKTAGEPSEPNGLTIEGIAVASDRVFVGLRAPSDQEKGGTFLVEASAHDLFAREPGAEHAPSRAVPKVTPLALGETVGIRDLTFLPDGRLLIMAGPAQEQRVPYSLHIFDSQRGNELKKIGTLKKPSGENEDAKAEAIALLGPDRVLILFDGALNGEPREYALSSPLY